MWRIVGRFSGWIYDQPPLLTSAFTRGTPISAAKFMAAIIRLATASGYGSLTTG
ncbi:hypothetical protein ACFOGG_08980 [Brenneria rubrifaciens]|uniref:hypothetical protein n=1 Tax=Brenneria rubrifaciens TaxID=55213 RepID=UPI00361E53D4